MKFNTFGCQTKEYLEDFQKILEKLICLMNSACLNNSISHNFIVQMIPHHRAAIEMSRNILKYTDNEMIMNIAVSIISEQTKSIADMRNALCSCDDVINLPCETKIFQRKINTVKEKMFSKMRNAYSDNCLNCNFIREMLPHHKGAVEMSEITLEFDICDTLKPILEAIITTQKRGIQEMESLMEKLDCRYS